MEIQDVVSTYEVDWQYDEPMSVHVVDETGTTVLVGGGAAASGDEIVEIATEHDVDVVIGEHGDPDHMNAIPVIREALDVTVAVPSGDARFFEEAGIDPDRLLHGGATYWGIRTISMPGHTPDNMAFLVGDVLIAGDTVVGTNSIHTADEDWSGPLAVTPPSYNPDDEQMRASVGRLRHYDFEIVLCSHGDHVLKDGHAAVETLVADLG
jgi:glyoxylase-like metal-dependent hydrolase (beta-lactamase superfamily II)